MRIERLKANIDFPSNDTFRITTPYKQRVFKAEDFTWFNLEKLTKLKPGDNGKFELVDFYLIVDKMDLSPSKKFKYKIRATVAEGRRDVVAEFYHNEPTNIEVKIYR